MTGYAEPRFALNPLLTEQGMVAGSTPPVVTLHTATCSLVRPAARYVATVVEVEQRMEATPWALVPCELCNPRQEGP